LQQFAERPRIGALWSFVRSKYPLLWIAMKPLHRSSLILLCILSGVPAAAAQDATVAEASNIALPTSEAGVPGVGPIRNEPWFVQLWNDRRTAFAEHAEQDRGALVFLGDSITQGWGDDFRGDFAGVHVANRGISGDTTRGLLMRLGDDVLALDPSGIVLLIGTNDIDVGVKPADVADNVKVLLEQIAAYDNEIPVILCQVMPTSATKNRPTDKIRELNRELAEVANGNEQVTVLDTYTLFANDEGDAKPEEFPDLLHPNEAGYSKWRAALWPLLATHGFVDSELDDFQPEEGFEPLLHGRDLTGWGYRPTTDEDRRSIEGWKRSDPNMPPWPIVEEAVAFDAKQASDDGRFRVVNGRLVVTTPTEGRKIQKLLTVKDFPGDFTLKLEFRATPNADSGVFLRGRQLQCRDYTLAGPYNELQGYKPQDWNELVVEVRGNAAHCTCNGEVLEAAYELPETGPIGVEGDRGQVEYRRMRIKRE
jgi:lysophospholipase L1-like esterase